MERLSAAEGRVVASLVEKALAVPQSYPLTLNALVSACNQTSSRDPVTTYAEHEVLAALEGLRARHLVRAVLPSHGRSVVRYRHVLDESLGLDPPQLAVLAVLELRGPQTPAELRSRTERMAQADDVDHELELLAGREPPLVARVGRRAGEKQARWVALLSEAEGGGPGQPAVTAEPGPARHAPGADGGDVHAELVALRAEVVELREALAALESTVASLGSTLASLRESLGG